MIAATFRVNARPKREAEFGCELPRWIVQRFFELATTARKI
jgi:hypothetical protein